MKTVKLRDTIKRVTDKEATNMVNKLSWKFITKSEWKETARKTTKKVKETTDETKSDKKRSKKK